jgi:hypothetical protein
VFQAGKAMVTALNWQPELTLIEKVLTLAQQ